MNLESKVDELSKLDEAIKTELKLCDDQLAAWRERRGVAERNQLVLSGRQAQLQELMQSDVPSDPTPAAYTTEVDPDAELSSN